MCPRSASHVHDFFIMILIYFALLISIATQNHGYVVKDRAEGKKALAYGFAAASFPKIFPKIFRPNRPLRRFSAIVNDLTTC